METQFYQIKLSFKDAETKSNVEKIITDENDEKLFVDPDVDKALAVDPITLTLIAGLLIGGAGEAVGSEITKWIIEKFKTLFGKKKISNSSNAVPIEISVNDKKFLFTYDPSTKKHTLEELTK